MKLSQMYRDDIFLTTTNLSMCTQCQIFTNSILSHLTYQAKLSVGPACPLRKGWVSLQLSRSVFPHIQSRSTFTYWYPEWIHIMLFKYRARLFSSRIPFHNRMYIEALHKATHFYGDLLPIWPVKQNLPIWPFW